MSTSPDAHRDDLLAAARKVGNDWVGSAYYDKAEDFISKQWKLLVWPMISAADFSQVVEIASGHGRNTALLLPLCERMVATDINVENTDFLARRFPIEVESGKLSVIRNNGIDLAGVADNSATFVYSFDAMVHFDSDVVRAYIKEAARVLKPGGTALFHYSNVTADPSAHYRKHERWRNFMSRDFFEHWAIKEKLEVVSSVLVKWNQHVVPVDDGNTDAITCFRKPITPVTITPEKKA